MASSPNGHRMSAPLPISLLFALILLCCFNQSRIDAPIQKLYTSFVGGSLGGWCIGNFKRTKN
jgi:hypothetical protein